ncbi:glycosyltransferase family 2 protein [Candidatus Woesearchaeota archaeon]|nr:glycosyltransferase family 2 protein [Candidatus Woesearchaeota archaeon]
MVNYLFEAILWTSYLVSLYFSVFLLLVYLEKKPQFISEKSSLTLPNSREWPFVSVIVPAHNEEKTILKTLESIEALDYPKEKLEVIAIDDGSKDDTKEKIIEYISDKPHFRLISHSNMGKAASMNKALAQLKGEFFACLDADSFVDSSTLKKMLAFYYQQNNERLAIVTPAMKVHHPKNILQKVQWLEYVVMILFGRLTSQLDSLYVAPGPFSLYRTDILRQLGGFDPQNITEDQEIAYRLQKHQYQIKQCFNGFVYTTAPDKIPTFYRQRRRWYLGSLGCLYQYKGLVANKKYGDFGLMQMVKNVTEYLLAIAGLSLAGYLFFIPLFEQFKMLFLVKFNILPYLSSLNFNFNFFNFLLFDLNKIWIIFLLFLTGSLFFYWAHQNAQEKMSVFGLFPLIPYFFFYYLLKGSILMVSLVQFHRSKKIKW